MEGTLKVYWGLKKPVELKANDFSYWRSFHPVDDDGSFPKNVSTVIQLPTTW